MTTRVGSDPARGATDDIDIWWISAEMMGELHELIGTCVRPLAAYHRLGELVARVRPRGPSPFDGTGWFRTLARRLGCSTQLLGRCQRLFELYSRAAVERMAEDGLTWSHAAALIRVRNGSLREELMADAVEGGWTAAELARRTVGLTRGPAVVSRAPRPLAAGYAALLGLRNLVKVTNRYAALAGRNWSGSTAPLGEQLRVVLAGCDGRTRHQIVTALTTLAPALARVGVNAAAECASLRRLLEERATPAA